MSTATSVVTACATFIGGILVALLSDLFSEEMRSRLDGLPRTLILLVSRALPSNIREQYKGDWLAVLNEFLHGNEARPITRLVKGTYFALSLTRAAWYVRREYAPTKSIYEIRRRRLIMALFAVIVSGGAVTQYGFHSEHVNTEATGRLLAIILVTELVTLTILTTVVLVLRYYSKHYMDHDYTFDALDANEIKIWREGDLVGAFQAKYPMKTKDQIEFYTSDHLARVSQNRVRANRPVQCKCRDS